MRILGLALVSLLALTSQGSGETLAERGQYLVEGLGACGNCHTPKGPQGDIQDRHLAGGFGLDMAFGSWVAPNITPDRLTGIGTWTDAQIVRAIRDGKHRDGRTLGPPMPYQLYRGLSNRDVKAMVAYLRTVRPVFNQVLRSRYRITLPASYGPLVKSVREPSRKDPVRYGRYLAGAVAHCVECHSPHKRGDQPDLARPFAGGFLFVGPWGTSYSANITPDEETGIGKWTDDEIVRATFNGVKPGGGTLLPPMPWPYYAGRVTDADARAIVAYLRSVRAIVNKVPPAEPPNR